MPETSSFHFPWGEMTITLDDVSALLHIPVEGKFFSLGNPNKEEAISVLVELLDVGYEDAFDEVEKCRGPSVRYSWLDDVVTQRLAEKNTIAAARAFLLRLAGLTMFCDKSNFHVDVSYIELFRDVHVAGQYAWGAAGLAFLYNHLGDASKKSSKGIAGYLTLLQVGILLVSCRMLTILL